MRKQTVNQDQRRKLLEAHNSIKNILSTLEDCKDLWLSDVKELENILLMLRDEFEFVPPKDDEGRSGYWLPWILKEEDNVCNAKGRA